MNKEMKKGFVLLFAAFLFVACEPETGHLIVNNFEDLVVEGSGYDNGSDKSGDLIEGTYVKAFISGSVSLMNRYTYDDTWGFGSWEGFAVSTHIDSVTPGFVNQYSVIAGQGANGSAKFVLAYDSAEIHFPYINSYQKVKSVMLTNSTWTYYDILQGGYFPSKFADGDWFKVVIKGYSGDNETGQVEFYLADYRDGKTMLVRDWTKVSLAKLGTVTKVTFTFESSNDFTPKYVCVDDLVVEVEEGCDCIKD